MISRYTNTIVEPRVVIYFAIRQNIPTITCTSCIRTREYYFSSSPDCLFTVSRLLSSKMLTQNEKLRVSLRVYSRIVCRRRLKKKKKEFTSISKRLRTLALRDSSTWAHICTGIEILFWRCKLFLAYSTTTSAFISFVIDVIDITRTHYTRTLAFNKM